MGSLLEGHGSPVLSLKGIPGNPHCWASYSYAGHLAPVGHPGLSGEGRSQLLTPSWSLHSQGHVAGRSLPIALTSWGSQAQERPVARWMQHLWALGEVAGLGDHVPAEQHQYSLPTALRVPGSHSPSAYAEDALNPGSFPPFPSPPAMGGQSSPSTSPPGPVSRSLTALRSR